ncbi:MAG: serine hydrolase domain-containing protein [Erysipelotrichia bacterium]|nr:serine hydrolase domain-containing protein [Erysipelotrichia bacterium]
MILNRGKEIIKRYVDNNELPGAVFAYVERDYVEKDLYGYKSLLPVKEKLNFDTLYDIASLSKVVATSTMVFKLVEEGLISFKTKVRSILPEYPFEDVIVRDLLTHVSGIAGDDKDYKKCKTEEQLWQFIMNLPRIYDKGTKCVYSCFGYIILGKIIEHYKGSLEKYLDETLCEPLGTSNIMYCPQKKGRESDCAATEVTEARGIIKGVVHDGKCNIMNGVAGNAGIFADIDSLTRYVQMILNDGVYNGNTVLKKSTVQLLKKVYTPGLNEMRTIGGWLAGDLNQSDGDYVSEHSLYHTGFTGTSIYIDFDRGCGIILLANAVHPSRVHKMIEIRNLFHNQVLIAADESKI